MLAHASPSYKIAIMITGIVIDCLGTNNFLVTKGFVYQKEGTGGLITHKYRGSQQFSISKSVEPNEELKAEQILSQVLPTTNTTLRTLDVYFT